MAALGVGQAVSSFTGCRLRRTCQNGNLAKCSAMRKDIHPTFYPESKIFCNGVEVMVCGGTKEKYIVDVWSGNHPFYQGAKTTIVMDDGRVSKFNKMYPDAVGTMGDVQMMNQGDDAAAAAAAAKAGPKVARLPKRAKK